jgi:protein phosphatase
MGATVAALTFTPTTVITANVGDTAIFLYRQGSLEPLYVPHTVDAERLPSDPRQAEVLRARYRHILTKAMGLERSVQPEVFEVKVFSGDVFVLASDGITDVLEESEIVEVLAGTDRPQVICEELVQRALDAGGADNATVVAIRCQVRKTDFKTIWKALNTPVTPWGRK